MKKQSFIHVPNSIYNFNLSPSELLCYCTIASLKNTSSKHSSVTYATLSRLSGLSIATLVRALDELCTKQLITKLKQHYYDGNNRANGYIIANLCSKGFFRIPRKIIEKQLAPSAFAIFAFLCKCADKDGKAFPSLSRIACGTELTVKTVITHLNSLVSDKIVHRSLYIRYEGGFGHSQYSISGLQNTKHHYKTVKLHKRHVFVSKWKNNRINLESQLFALKGIDEAIDVLQNAQSSSGFSITNKAYHEICRGEIGTVKMSKQYLYPSIYGKRIKYMLS